jgi:hypothetical protein
LRHIDARSTRDAVAGAALARRIVATTRCIQPRFAMTASPFSQDFESARALFRSSAAAAGARLDAHRYPVCGPRGEELSTDVAWLGPPAAKKVFVTVSGTHGVEGFCGSGAQVAWLQRGEAARLPPDTAAMLVHALNPFGFAWRRRVTHENIDLNRNWIDFSRPLPQCEQYDTLAAILCPPEWTDESRTRTLQSLRGYVATHGYAAFVAAVSGGQYNHACGLFYGGTAPSAARLTLESILRERLAQAEQVGIIDYHTGLGPLGYGELMTSAPAGSEHCERARRWYGASVTPIGSEASASAALSGDWMAAVPGLLPQATTTTIAIEFGTVDGAAVLEALRADNWLHAHGDPLGAESAAIKEQVFRAFYIDDDTWRGMILGQSLAASRQAIAGLQL